MHPNSEGTQGRSDTVETEEEEGMMLQETASKEKATESNENQDDKQKGNEKFCEACSDFAQLIHEVELETDTPLLSNNTDWSAFSKENLGVIYQYLSVWVQRQCLCLYRDTPTIERACLLFSNFTRFCVFKLKNLGSLLEEAKEKSNSQDDPDHWTYDDIERLLLFMAKIFMLQFPLYAGPKQVGHRFEEPSTAEATQLAVFCDVHDSSEFPIALLRNVTLFCKSGGLQGMAMAFKLSPTLLPTSMAHALISILCNIKLWLNHRVTHQLVGPVRTNGLIYMCSLSDQELRTQPARNISDFLWCSSKENVESPIIFDKDGLELAFKYFCSTTLTMRLAGIAQINSQITLFNEMFNTESVVEVENVGLQLANWILNKNIVELIFGPNLHVEVIKQSSILLNFLAMEGKITNDHITAIWQASLLKHCSKQVQDLMLSLIKNLEAGPVLHLYDLLKTLPVKEHTEQTIHLAQVLQKFLWTTGGTLGNIIQDSSTIQLQQQKRQRTSSDERSKNKEDSSSEEEKGFETKQLSSLERRGAKVRSFIALSGNGFNLNELELDEEEGVNEYSEEDDDEEVDEEEEEEEEDEGDEDGEEDELQTSDEEEAAIRVRGKRPHPNNQQSHSAHLRNSNTGDLSHHMESPKAKIPRKNETEEENPPMFQETNSKETDKRQVETPTRESKRQHLDEESSDSENDNRPEMEKTSESTDAETTRRLLALREKTNMLISDDKSSPLTGNKGNAWWPSDSSPSSSGHSTAMAELANLVNAHPRSARPLRLSRNEVVSLRPVITSVVGQKNAIPASETPVSEGSDNESESSRLSDKNLVEFEEENSLDEEDMLNLAQQQNISALLQQQHQLANMALYHQRMASPRMTVRQQRQEARIVAQYKLERACEPGNTLLWDLLQDDKIEELPDGLVFEAEKALTSLLCYNMDRFIRMKFIEGCLANLEHNKTVAISLRLLPKLIQSFNHFRGVDTHEICMFIEKNHGMTRLFFENLKLYTKERTKKAPPFFNHPAQIQIRLHFLTVLFSVQVTPMEFKLTNEQINVLWECLANDPFCADDLFQYLLLQVHSKEQHAICLDGFKMIYSLKLPTLKPETISMIGLNLFSQLCQLSRLTRNKDVKDSDVREDNNKKMDQLWKIALCAHNTDVSMKAIQILNSLYFGQGEDFLVTCMNSLEKASNELGESNDEVLIRIQRALLLLKTYLETFRRKYAYHLRRMSIEGQGVTTHAELVDLRSAGPLRIIVQAAGFSEKATFEMQAIDLVADLRAEISAWWEAKLSRQMEEDEDQPSSSQHNEGPLRLITQGQELPIDVDEKSLGDIGFKDGQLIFVSQGASRGLPTSGSGNASQKTSDIPPFPGKEKMPMNLLLKPENFDRLFTLMQTLSSVQQGGGSSIPKAQILSRRVWDILLLLPTNPDIKKSLQNIAEVKEDELKRILDPQSPQKLMYTFYIVEWLGRPTRLRRHSGVVEQPGGSQNPSEQPWAHQFVGAGGLKHLFEIFLSGQLQKSKSSSTWCEWKQDCLSALLKLLVQFGVDPQDFNALNDQLLELSTSLFPRKRVKRQQRFTSESSTDSQPNTSRYQRSNGNNHLLIPRLSPTLLKLMHVESVIPRLTSVLSDASANRDILQYRTGLFGRAQVVHFTMSLLVSWIYSTDGAIEDAFFSSEGLHSWLRSLLLEDPDPAVRREVCTGLYKMCFGSTTTGKSGTSCTAPLLSVLTEFLDDAMIMVPNRQQNTSQHHFDEGKEPFGPACRDYFWIMCRLVDKLEETDSSSLVDLDQLARQLACGIVARKMHEKRHGDSTPDDALVGAINLLCNVCKHNPPFKTSTEGEDFILHLLECLFALPSPRDKDLPKCKSTASRTACYDLLVEMVKGSLQNYLILHGKLLDQHREESHLPYPWDYWPRDDGRADCGYVGLTNLGATCYMASSVQQLYMIPQARDCILRAEIDVNDEKEGSNSMKHKETFKELKKMFAYLRESERKAYNPLSFCKSYEMNQQTLNTGEQKDMAEFFIDLLSKMEEMSPDLKSVVKNLFGGTITNSVVSLDCGHVSRTSEEFFTVRCQVAEMRNLYKSLEEVTVKDTLEGENMYTCSQCNKKVRAEKRACFSDLPKVLAFNTMRYTFNYNTMIKEKVNSHFSFPFRLDMSPYMEENLLPKDKAKEKSKENVCYEYELIGVTVHTGTADGGHYYAFIRDRSPNGGKDKWYSFNDAEVKPFDPNQIAAECFGGEMNSRTYDQMTDKFMELSIEKTNSAYMLFYEKTELMEAGPSCKDQEENRLDVFEGSGILELSKDLEDWIWKDNMNFIQDNNIFDHAYFNFMWQMVVLIPTTLGERSQNDITLLSSKLSTSFFLESFIHAKEKLNIVQWVEFLTKQFDSSMPACSWFLDHMASDTNWPTTIFLKCQVGTIRQMFHRLCIHVIQKMRAKEKENYLLPWDCKDLQAQPSEEIRPKIGSTSPVTRFIRMLFSLLESGAAKPHLKYLTELFRFLYDFAKLGEDETRFLLSIRTISLLVDFYLKAIKQSSESMTIEVASDEDDEEDDDIIALPMNETNKMASLEKMVFLIALLVEKSRGEDNKIHLDPVDMASLVGPKSGSPLVFLFNITKDNISICQTCNLIFSLSRNNPELAEQVASMVFHGIKQADYSMHFFRLLTMLTELTGGPSGMPCFTSLVMHKIWDLAKTVPQAALDWLSIQVTRNRYVQTWLLSTMETWVEPYLLAHPNQKVRNSAAFLVVSLVPSAHFRQAFRSNRSILSPVKQAALSHDEAEPLTEIIQFLFGLLPNARNYVDLQQHGPGKLVAYFQTLTHCLLTRNEKLLFEPHFMNLWQLFHPKLSEPSIPVHHNKQALLNLWYTLCVDCPENVQLILQNPQVVKNIAFNYILADHEDAEVINFNRVMLPSYYGLLRMCCIQSRSFTRNLAQHQNIQWAFKNITPYHTQYTLACEELFKLMSLFVQTYPEMTEEELAEVRSFRHQTLQLYLTTLDGRSAWTTLIKILKILVKTNEDRIFVLYNNGLALIFEAINMLHVMYHEATACHVSGELVELILIFQDLLKAVREQRNASEITQVLTRWKDMPEMTGRLLTLCNSYTPHEMRDACINTVKEMLMLWPQEMLSILVPMLHRSHSHGVGSDSDGASGVSTLGPFFPRKNPLYHQHLNTLKSTSRPPQPMLQMSLASAQLEAPNGQDPEYDKHLQRYFIGYHSMIDLMVRLAVNEDKLSKMLVDLSAMAGLDGVPLHFQLFPKLWLDIFNTEQIDRKYITMLLQSHGFLEYIDAVLLDERNSLNNVHTFKFLMAFFPKVADRVLNDQMQIIISDLVRNFIGSSDSFSLNNHVSLNQLTGDLRALILVSTARPDLLVPNLLDSLLKLRCRLNTVIQEHEKDNNLSLSVRTRSSSSSTANEASEAPMGSLLETSEGNESDKASESNVSKADNSSSPRASSSSDKTDEKLSEAFITFKKTLNDLIEMCEKRNRNSNRMSEDVDGEKREKDEEDDDSDKTTENSKALLRTRAKIEFIHSEYADA